MVVVDAVEDEHVFGVVGNVVNATGVRVAEGARVIRCAVNRAGFSTNVG